jgi:uncharacterized protein (DUF952 family)
VSSGPEGQARAERVFHLATVADWEAAQRSGQIVPASLQDEGFVHCSTTSQLAGTIDRHFTDAHELVLVELSPEVGEELRWEESRPGEAYPHLYRAIAAIDVAGVHRWRRASDGSTHLPDPLR